MNHVRTCLYVLLYVRACDSMFHLFVQVVMVCRGVLHLKVTCCLPLPTL